MDVGIAILARAQNQSMEPVLTSSDGCGPLLLTTLNSPWLWLQDKCAMLPALRKKLEPATATGATQDVSC